MQILARQNGTGIGTQTVLIKDQLGKGETRCRGRWLPNIYANPSKAELYRRCRVKQELYHGPVTSGRFMQIQQVKYCGYGNTQQTKTPNRKRRNRQQKGDIAYRVLPYYFYSSLVYLLAKEYKCRYELLKVYTIRASNTQSPYLITSRVKAYHSQSMFPCLRLLAQRVLSLQLLSILKMSFGFTH